MFIFILIPAAAAALGAIFSLTGGTSFVITAVAAQEWQRRKGYKRGEGALTRRENGSYYGVTFNEDAEHDLSQGLGALAMAAPDIFEPYIGKKYDFTKTEGDLLRALVKQALAVAEDLEDMKVFVFEHQEELGPDECIARVNTASARLVTAVIPLVKWLEQFPTSRTKKGTP